MGEVDTTTSTLEQLKAIIRRDLKLPPDATIADDMSLTASPSDVDSDGTSGAMEYDSLDILLVLTSVEKTFGVTLIAQQNAQHIFDNLIHFAQHIDDLRAPGGTPPGSDTSGRADGSAAVAGDSQNHRLPEQDKPTPVSERVEAVPATPTPTAKDPSVNGLPHQDPFRFVTRYTTIVPAQSGLGEWKITGHEAFFQGHFPGNPIVPGVLISEAMAQVCGLVQGSGRGNHHAGVAGSTPEPLALVHVDVKFHLPVKPPSVLVVSASCAATIGQLIRFDAIARVQGKIVAQGQITLGQLSAEGRVTSDSEQ